MTNASSQYDIGRARRTDIVYGLICTAPHCQRKRTVGNRYCSHHRNVAKYRGHPLQEKIPIRSINFAKKAVATLAYEMRDRPEWKSMMEVFQSRFNAARSEVEANLKQIFNGRAVNKGVRNAYVMLYDIFTRCTVEEALIIYAGFQYLERLQPRLFNSDVSLRHAIVKSIRAKAKSLHGYDFDKRTGKQTRYSSDLFNVQRETAFELLNRIYGAVGYRLYNQVEARAEKLRSQKEKLDDAIKQIAAG